MKYTVTIQEILEREVVVEAESRIKAKQIVRQLYNNSDIILSNEDYTTTAFSIS